MLDGRSCLVSRALPSSCEQESKWVYMNYHLIEEVSNGKRHLEEGTEEEIRERKSTRLSNSHVNEELNMAEGFSTPPVDDSNKEACGGDQSDLNSLIHPLGRDITINCLLHLSRSDYGALASLNRSFNSLVRSGELYKLRRQVGICEHWVYFSCNVLEWEAFDPNSRRWMHLPSMPANDCFMFSDKQSQAVGTELLVFGKEVTSHVILRYSILTNSWSSGMVMNTPRCLFGSASLGEIVIFAGGIDARGTVLNSVELYNSETGTWETLPSMNKPRKNCSAVFLDKKLYIMGGLGSNVESYTCGEEYNLETKTWRVIPDMYPVPTVATEPPPLHTVVNNELYAADHAEKELRKYNKENNTWVTLGRLPERVFSMNGWGLAFKGCGERLIIVGGPRGSGGGTVELHSWIPGDGPPEWELLAIARRPSGSFVYNCAVMGC
ncbi:F-box/kelch-repeat protein SKIP11-like [Magnolia sinica]|uniref:F-box/kelch-repeat protein SKIP11-like n=1 Tax=Magnolia sinica TaxID=86752 RepID=UPI002659522C|nr:F-box/kelch-repeat protein SKIP11-like [Magnolia sinica]